MVGPQRGCAGQAMARSSAGRSGAIAKSEDAAAGNGWTWTGTGTAGRDGVVGETASSRAVIGGRRCTGQKRQTAAGRGGGGDGGGGGGGSRGVEQRERERKREGECSRG
jgi:hypothetical protein